MHIMDLQGEILEVDDSLGFYWLYTLPTPNIAPATPAQSEKIILLSEPALFSRLVVFPNFQT